MSERPKKAEERKSATPPKAQEVEFAPSVQNKISALASANAPFVFFDGVAFYSQGYGIGSFTLTAARQIAELPDKTVASDYVITALLRAPLPALAILRNCIDEVLRLASEPMPTSDAVPSSEMLN